MGALPLNGVSNSSKWAWAVLCVLPAVCGGCSDSDTDERCLNHAGAGAGRGDRPPVSRPQTTPEGKKALQEVFDLDKDGTITEQELRDNPIIAALISTPDVDTDSDGTPDAFSIGFRFASVPCTITKP